MSETEQKVEKPEEVKKEEVEIKQEQEEKTHEEHEGHEHHDHDHHDHDHPHEHAEAKKSNRGEKKFKKAMLKLGMKQVTGINRVTIKKTKQLLLYIDNPEVLKSAGQDNSYIIFGEAKIHDMPQNIANDEMKKFQPEKPVETTDEQPTDAPKEETVKTEEVKEEKKEEKEVEVNEDSIKIVMEQTKCTREKAIDALKKTNNDAVTAIMDLSA